MAITIQFPGQVEDTLRANWGDLDQAAKEALIIESYRQAKISLGDVARGLGLETRIGAQQWLANHGIPLNYDIADWEADCNTLHTLFG
jgi:predicted HTH domain antitoxin